MNTRRSLPALLLSILPVAALTLTACGGGDAGTLTDEGNKALGSGDYSTAESKYSDALAKLEPGAPRYVEAKLGYACAQAYSDAAAAQTTFMELTQQADVNSGHYRTIVVDLTSASAFPEATAILKAGKQAHPEYEKWQELVQIVGKKAESAGDEETLNALRGLGYVGDD